MNKRTIASVYKGLLVLALLYLFLVSISLMGASLKGFGKGFAEGLIQTTSNPFVGLFIGILVTSIIQSSSTTTSITVGMVASGVLTVKNAIPIIMGANIGTAVTCAIVSLSHIGRKEEFRRAFAGATMHDFFNLLTVLILFPVELATGILGKLATALAGAFSNVGGMKLVSPVKVAVKPAVHMIKSAFVSYSPFPQKINSFLMLALALVFLFTALGFLVKVMKSVVSKRTEIVFDNLLGRNVVIGMLLGTCFTAIVQSSSITTSMLVPLVGAGLLTVEKAFPVTLGANVGTTVTAIIAALAGNIHGITIAFAHLLFNVIGITMIYPIKFIRNIPLRLAKGLAAKAAESRKYAIIFVLSVFFLIPGIFVLLSKLFKW